MNKDSNSPITVPFTGNNGPRFHFHSSNEALEGFTQVVALKKVFVNHKQQCFVQFNTNKETVTECNTFCLYLVNSKRNSHVNNYIKLFSFVVGQPPTENGRSWKIGKKVFLLQLILTTHIETQHVNSYKA